MILPNGYVMETTFWDDFSIADKFGSKAIKDTYNRAFTAWKDNYVYLTELTIVLNLKLWHYHNIANLDYTILYESLWKKTDKYACSHLKGDELSWFYKTTD